MNLQLLSRLAVLVTGVIFAGSIIGFARGRISAWEFAGFALIAILTALNAIPTSRAHETTHG